MESFLLKSANGGEDTEEFEKVHDSVFRADLQFDRLRRQLDVLVDIVHNALPDIKTATSIHTI